MSLPWEEMLAMTPDTHAATRGLLEYLRDRDTDGTVKRNDMLAATFGAILELEGRIVKLEGTTSAK